MTNLLAKKYLETAHTWVDFTLVLSHKPTGNSCLFCNELSGSSAGLRCHMRVDGVIDDDKENSFVFNKGFTWKNLAFRVICIPTCTFC